ncbi:hypothetical protein OEIGOIKO_04767 [Streptomyces chrestomyceticus JCM 4735]|uniref:Uncharacterized protein n=1 Tax=Streptomyces chrestomyceticus JCM 4735 TaxID=1306181 RepID=A0A7U9KX61_9ACTN|nr:hypothetical protein [Streptomyces chrestomyceticus]GCD36986.1 hypothetical protein OEIGOIKO_04767 [Streptomyces chrestomyceticus JCM 4735]
MRAKRRSVIRTAAVATGVAAALLLPVSGAFAATDATAATTQQHATGRLSALLPENGLAGVAERIGELPAGGLAGAAGVLGAAGVGVAMHRRRQAQQV